MGKMIFCLKYLNQNFEFFVYSQYDDCKNLDKVDYLKVII